MAADQKVPPVLHDIIGYADVMSDVELMMVLGPILTILAKRRGLEFVRKAMESAIGTLEREVFT